ncbi:MAG TPA: gamma-glutamyltransferase family protein [Steroidobacteraceae bacterium]|nr:gamma-glutamyltransferase family protein [Steroidobacteraceae bacterium]
MHRYLLLAALLFAACTPVEPARQPAPAEGAPAPVATPAAPAAPVSKAGVAAANPYAVDAGIEILEAGGGAADAAVAVQAMLGLVEPQSSGIGGGGFMLYYDAASKKMTAFDGREAAPKAAPPDMFLRANGEPMSYAEAVVSGRSTGVPGAIAMLGAVHARQGRLPWARLFEPAIRAAERGIVVPKRLARFLNSEAPQAKEPDVRALFSRPDGTPLQAGDPFRNPQYAATLRRIASQGPRALLEPPLRDAIIARTHEEPRPGTLAAADFEAYQPRIADPLCGPYLVYLVCVPPPPSSGVVVLEALAILDRTDIASRGPADPQGWFLFAMASRLMYADRDRFVADPEFVPVPVRGLLEPHYISRRAALIGDVAGPAPPPGEPANIERGADATREAAGTSHFVVRDADGDIVSMTTTVESLFGSGRAVGGFVLNNQLSDFSFRPVVDGKPVANAVEGGKRPRSSMAPMIVLDAAGTPVAALGSPGGTSILAYNTKAIVGLLAWKLPLQQAIDLPNLIARGDTYFGEVGKFPPGVEDALAARGVTVKAGRGEDSGLHGLVIGADGAVTGAADPRREGVWKAAE